MKLSVNTYCNPHIGHYESRTKYILGHFLLQNASNMIEESAKNTSKYHGAA